MKKIKLGMVVLSALLSFFLITGGMAKAEDGVTNDEIRIGTTLDLSGPIAFMGISVRDGAMMYFKYINDQGGIHGRKVKLLAEDDGFQSPRTVQAAKKLVTKDGIFCMTMSLGSANVFAMLPILEENKIPLLPAGTANEALAVPPRKYVFLTDTGYTIQGILAVKYMMTTLKAKNPKVAIIYQEDVTGQQWFGGVKAGCDKYGIKDVLELSFKRGAIDFGSQISKCKQAGITHIFTHTNVREPAAIMKEAQRIQYKAVYITDNASQGPKVLELIGDDALAYTNGYYAMGIINDFNTENTKGYQLYKQECKKANLPPVEIENTMRIWSFQAAMTLCEVLQRAGKDLTREGFIKAAETMKNYDNGIEVPTTWSPDRRDGGRSVKIYKAEKGNLWVPKTGWISQ
jgi:branched-chain amino acid transport system substrate-binding protein